MSVICCDPAVSAELYNDLVELNTSSLTWTNLSNLAVGSSGPGPGQEGTPDARYGHVLRWNSGDVFVFGGQTRSGVCQGYGLVVLAFRLLSTV